MEFSSSTRKAISFGNGHFSRNDWALRGRDCCVEMQRDLFLHRMASVLLLIEFTNSEQSNTFLASTLDISGCGKCRFCLLRQRFMKNAKV